jgi:hypothetical protein
MRIYGPGPEKTLLETVLGQSEKIVLKTLWQNNHLVQ